MLVYEYELKTAEKQLFKRVWKWYLISSIYLKASIWTKGSPDFYYTNRKLAEQACFYETFETVVVVITEIWVSQHVLSIYENDTREP